MSTAVPPEIRMVNNIAVQFGHLPLERAAEEVANHVLRFWDPRMRTRLIQLASDTDDLDPVVRAAADLVRAHANPERLVSVRTADGWLEVDLAAPQALRGVTNALGIHELAEGETEAIIERVTAHWSTREVLLALEQEDVRPRRSSVDSEIVTP